ncbi:Calpain-9 [Liparis tanakae]|uniref:Calpain-9 n=1 Tax=Liparis tanakae TaxID=230148 RepID=A0A4Z2G352_9TELE|nr:Calpain-9 [Liparis tanakae]
MEVCHLTNALSKPGSTVRPWCCVMHHGNWVPNTTAGGSANGGLFWQNPQYYFTLLEVDSETANSRKTCSFVLSLMQKHQRRRGVNLAIALHIYPDLRVLRPVLCSPNYSTRREVVLRGSLPPGRYIIISSTVEANQKGAFLLRVLTEQGNAATPSRKPQPDSLPYSFPHEAALPSPKSIKQLFKKHCSKGLCKPVQLHNLLNEALQAGVLAGSENYLVLEHCKSLVVLMDVSLKSNVMSVTCHSQGNARLNWPDFQALWDKIRRWTDIFLIFDINKTNHLEYKEVGPALKKAELLVASHDDIRSRGPVLLPGAAVTLMGQDSLSMTYFCRWLLQARQAATLQSTSSSGSQTRSHKQTLVDSEEGNPILDGHAVGIRSGSSEVHPGEKTSVETILT